MWFGLQDAEPIEPILDSAELNLHLTHCIELPHLVMADGIIEVSHWSAVM